MPEQPPLVEVGAGSAGRVLVPGEANVISIRRLSRRRQAWPIYDERHQPPGNVTSRFSSRASQKVFQGRRRFLAAQGHQYPRGRRCQLSRPAGRNVRSGRRIRLRQDDARPDGHPSARSDRRRIVFDGQRHRQPQARGRCARIAVHIQMIFQDPSASLDPAHDGRLGHRRTAEYQRRPVQGTRSASGSRNCWSCRAEQLFLEPLSARVFGRATAAIGIARALALNPKLVICDEPVSALDVSIQAQVLNLLRDLQQQFHLTYLFIAHNLAVVAHIGDRIGVMYLGKLVEVAASRDITEDPRHPYTKALISAIPVPIRRVHGIGSFLRAMFRARRGRPSGCRFHPRCPIAQANCSVDEPDLLERHPTIGSPATTHS